jgi:hypothetical protein
MAEERTLASKGIIPYTREENGAAFRDAARAGGLEGIGGTEIDVGVSNLARRDVAS